MRKRLRRISVVLAGLLVLAAVVLGARALWDRAHRTDLRSAIDLVPRSTQRLTFTDWEQVREAVGIPATTRPSPAQVEKLTSRGYDLDLTAVSSIDESTAALQEHLGFSGTSMLWEAFAQGRSGATMVARMPDDTDFDAIRDTLRDSGFEKPATSEGVWVGGVDLIADLDPSLSPEVQFVVLLADRHLVVTSDNADYAAQAAAVARGKKPSLGDVASVRDLADRSGRPAAATLWARDFACSDLSMSQADEDTRAQAEAAVAAAGKVTPVSGLAMTLDADRRFSTIAVFESGAQAEANLRARARLAVGDAYGRGGSFSDDLRLTTSKTDGDAVVLRWRPRQKEGFVLSALDSGPVVFATC